MQRKIEDIYKKVEHKEHILMRPERHVGTCKPRTELTWVPDDEGNFVFKEITYRPAMLKLFDEIITNSVDFSKTKEGKHLNRIDVDICPMSGCITIKDNGGIAVVKHKDYDGWLPDMLFGELFSSSNYNENDEELSNKTGAGQNGEGASLVNVFSKLFSVTTCDGELKFERTWRNNSNDVSKESITKSKFNGTTISFIPDVSRFPDGNLDHEYKMMSRRVYEIAACNPKIKVTLNGSHIAVQDFNDFADKLKCEVMEDSNPDWNIALFHSTNGFTHFSYVNSVQTRVGGPHIAYVMDKIVEHARPKLKSRYKVDYKPSFIKNVLGLVLVCNIDLPRFNGQTKEDMTTTVSEFGTKWEPTEKFLRNSTKKIVEWFKGFHQSLELKAEDEALDTTQKEVEQLKFYQIPKYMRATSKNREECTLFLTEGDSAAKPIIAAANRKIHGIYPLKGKIVNALNASRKAFASSNEIKNIVGILGGLKLRGGVEESKLRYSSIVLAMDADVDGIHIRGLVALAFLMYWPEFIKQGRLKYLETPVVVAYEGKKRHEFFSESDFEAVRDTIKFTRVKYLKGLGSNDTKAFVEYLNNPKYSKTFVLDDLAQEYMDLAFDDSNADKRKELFKQVEYYETE